MATKALTVPQVGDWVEIKKPRKGRSFLKKGSRWLVEAVDTEKSQSCNVGNGEAPTSQAYRFENLYFDEIIPSSPPLVKTEPKLSQSSDPAWDDPDYLKKPDLGDSSTLNKDWGDLTNWQPGDRCTYSDSFGDRFGRVEGVLTETLIILWDGSPVTNKYEPELVRKMGIHRVDDLGDSSTLNDLGDSSTLNDLGDSSTLNDLGDNPPLNNEQAIAIPDLGDTSTLNLKKLLLWSGELPEKELNQVIDALIGLRAAQFPGKEEASQPSGTIEYKMINGCGPYKYLRYWSGGRHRSIYMGKVS